MQNIHINYSINFFSLCEKLKGTYEKERVPLIEGYNHSSLPLFKIGHSRTI